MYSYILPIYNYITLINIVYTFCKKFTVQEPQSLFTLDEVKLNGINTFFSSITCGHNTGFIRNKSSGCCGLRRVFCVSYFMGSPNKPCCLWVCYFYDHQVQYVFLIFINHRTVFPHLPTLSLYQFCQLNSIHLNKTLF